MRTLSLAICLLLLSYNFQSFVTAQCTNDNTYYMDLTPTGVGNTQTSSCTNAGEYNTVSVVAGISYTFSTCNAGYDTQITLVNDGTGAVEGYNDDFCGLQSQITWTATYTGVLRVLLDQFYCTHNATCTEISVTQNTSGPAANPCNSAMATTCGATVTGSTVGEAAPNFGTCGTTVGTGGSVWYTFTGDGNTWTAETTGGSNYDTKIWVFSGSCGALTCVTGNDDGGVGTLSLVNFATTNGTTYYVIVGGFGSSQGNYEMTLTNDANCGACAPPAAPITTDGSNCGPGVVNLSAAASGTGVLEWYDAPVGGNLIGTGTNYNPNLSATTTYYVQENASGGGPPTTITTLWAHNNGQSGIMFDITALNDVVINSFETNVDAVGDYEIYYRAGTHVGNTTNAGAWTLAGTATAVPNNPAGSATPIPVNLGVAIPAGQTFAFYITFTNGSFMNYTNGTAVGNVYTADANIQVKEGTGKAYSFGADYTPRIFNGIVHYTPGTVCASPRTAVTGNIVSPPTAPTAVDAVVCTNGQATMGAIVTSGNPGATLNWYDAPTGGNLMGTGTSMTTPPMTNNMTYYVEEDGGAPGMLSTLWAENNGQSGIMFDIAATNTVTITSFDMNVDNLGDWEIYYRTGTHVGSTTNAGAWTLVGTAASVPNNAAGTPTPIPIPVNVSIPAGQTYAFYVTYSTGTGMNYTNGTAVGNVYSSDANISIMEGTGKAYPFGADYSPRIPNMNVYYNTGSGCNSPRTAVNASIRTPAYALTASSTTTTGTCTVNEAGVDWTYYYDNATPEDLLFAIAKDPNNLGNNNFTANVDIDVLANSTTTGYYSAVDVPNIAGQWVMGRYWNVNILSGNMVDPVWVRFYYQQDEKNTIVNAANAFQLANGGLLQGPFHFKTVGVNFNPAADITATGINNSIDLTTLTDNLTTANAVNYVEYTGVASFSGGSIRVEVVPTLLSLSNIQFNAEILDETQGLLTWETSNEEELISFEVQRSTNAMDFETIAVMDAERAENGANYEFIDENPASGDNYYRLQLNYNDNSTEFTEVEALSFGSALQVMTVSPNPFNSNVEVELYCNEVAPVKFELININGQKVYEQEFLSNIGLNQIKLETLSALPSGNYILRINNGLTVAQRKLIKQ